MPPATTSAALASGLQRLLGDMIALPADTYVEGPRAPSERSRRTVAPAIAGASRSVMTWPEGHGARPVR